MTQENKEGAVDLQPKWSNAPTVEDLRKDLTSASSAHSAMTSRVRTYLDNLNIEGSAKREVSLGSSSITPMMIRKHAEWRYASLSEPLHTAASLFTSKPVTGEDGAIAEQDGTILNHQFENLIDKVGLVDESVRTGVDEGTVIWRTGWEVETETRKRRVPVVQNGLEIGTTIEEYEVVTKNQPVVDVVDYRSVIIDPTARGKIKDANFIIYAFPTNISKLKAQGYENLEAVDLGYSATESFFMDSESTEEQSFNFSDEARKKLTAYEYWGFWDINDNNVLIPIVATFVGNVMIRLKENPFPHRGLPFASMQYLPVRGENYGQPDGVLLEDNQKITGALTRGMIDLLGKSANGQVGIDTSALDAVNRLKFQRGEDYEMRPGTDPSKVIYQHTYPEIPNSALTMLQLQAQEAESMTGVKTYGEGISGGTLGDTAAGVNGALGAASKRESGILRRFAKGLEEVAKQVMSMNEVFLTAEEVERITGKPYVEPQLGARTTDVLVKIRTAEEDNQLASDLAFLGQTTEDPGLRQKLSAKVAKLKNMPDMAEEIANYKPEPDPLQQEMQMLQIELLKAQIANENGKAYNNQSSGVLDTAKAQTETVKAQNLAADTDLKKLEFVEEELGVNHERAMELQKAQAEGNMHLETLKKKTDAIVKGEA